jgi:hypothetical protein
VQFFVDGVVISEGREMTRERVPGDQAIRGLWWGRGPRLHWTRGVEYPSLHRSASRENDMASSLSKGKQVS